MRYKKLPIMLLFCGLACSVGPEYKTPQLELPPRFENLPETVKVHDPNQGPSPWWECFNDPLLNELIVAGVKANNDVGKALARVNEARAYEGEALLGLLPEINLSADYTEGVFGTATNPYLQENDRDYRAYQVSADLSWEIDLFGRVRKIIESRSANTAALTALLDDMLVAVQAQIAESYVKLRAAQLEKKIIRDSAKAQKASLKIAQAKFEVGAAGELDLSLARSQWNRTRARLPKIDAIESAALNRLAVLIGKHRSDLPKALRHRSQIPQCAGPLTILSPNELLRLRPDVRAAERQLAQATATIGVETAEFYPRIQLIGAIGLESSDLSGLSDSDADFNFWGPAISWKILNAGRIRKRVQAAGANAEYAYNHFEQTALMALEETENALKNYQSEKRATEDLLLAAESSRRALELARSQYEVGAVDYYQVLQTETSGLEIEQALVQTQAAFNQAHIAVFRAFGGGWVNQ